MDLLEKILYLMATHLLEEAEEEAAHPDPEQVAAQGAVVVTPAQEALETRLAHLPVKEVTAEVEMEQARLTAVVVAVAHPGLDQTELTRRAETVGMERQIQLPAHLYPMRVVVAVDCLLLGRLARAAQVAVETAEQMPKEAMEPLILVVEAAGQHLLAEQITRAQTAVQAWSSLKCPIP